MKEKINKLINKYGYQELFFIALYPIFLPFFMIKDVTFSIYYIVVKLLKYDWKSFSGNDQRNAYNNFFYYIQDFNIQKFGRYGISKYISGGNFSLKNWFHVTPFSLKIQSSFGTSFIMFFAMCFWLLSYVFIYQDNTNLWILFVVIFSTMFFATFIEIQNYNILGWMLYPLLFSQIESGNYLMCTLILFLIALSSFTGFFVASIYIVISSIYLQDYLLLITLIPAGIKWVIPVIASFKEKAITKLFGLMSAKGKVKYQRNIDKKLSIEKLYLFLCMVQFSGVWFYFNHINIYSILLVTTLGLFLVNEKVARFADQQSFYILYLTFSTILIFNTEINIFVFLSFCFAIYPVYGLMLNVYPRGKSFISPGIREPFSVKNDLESLYSLFSKANGKVFMCYKDPKGDYHKIFNGFRVFQEIIQYSAMKENVTLMPDWNMIFENNSDNNNEVLWFDDLEKITDFMKNKDIKYVIISNQYNNIPEQLDFVASHQFIFKETIQNHNNYSIELYKLRS